MKRLCQIYRSPRKPETYLYVEKSAGLEHVPESLLSQFGEPEELMVIVITPDKYLARANAAEVLQQIQDKGFYLQMPPTTTQLLHRDGSAN
ncbi:MAG: YcgL domain-containing protein [Halioglobus sp.]